MYIRSALIVLAIVPTVLASLLTASLAAPTVFPDAGAAATTPQTADDPALLRELAERGLAGYTPSGVRLRAQLLPGKLPADLAIPLPPGSRLVGTIVRPGDPKGMPGPFPSSETVLDSPLSIVDTLAFFQQQLPAAGWSLPASQSPGPRGFVGTLTSAYAVFCHGASGWLNVNINPGATTAGDVRLMWNGMPNGPCSQPQMGPGMKGSPPPGFDKLPVLVAPDGVAVQTAGGGPFGQNRASSEAIAKTDRTVKDLEAFYAGELAKAGWTRADGGAGDVLAWSTWKLPSAGWVGFLSVLVGADGQRDLTVRVESAAAFPGAPGKG